MTELDLDGPIWRCPACGNLQNADLELEHETCATCGHSDAGVQAPVPSNPDTGADDMPLTITQAENVARHVAGVMRDLIETTRQLVAARNRLAIVLEENRQLRALSRLAGNREALEALQAIADHSGAIRSASNKLASLGWQTRDAEGHDEGA